MSARQPAKKTAAAPPPKPPEPKQEETKAEETPPPDPDTPKDPEEETPPPDPQEPEQSGPEQSGPVLETATNLRTGETVVTEVPSPEQAYVAALQREREGYIRYGRDDRRKAVEAELKRLGAPLERAVTHPPETA